MSSSVDSSFFHAEATLPAGLPCYVERQADAELLKALHGGKFTVILSSRKVGKSSLMERAFATLRTEGVCVVKKELAEADKGITVESWYAGLAEEFVNDAKRRNGFQVDPTWRTWWSERANLPAGQRFTDFLRTFFLEPSTQPWVIALDEIDTTIPLPFSDDFFAAIRRCHNARAGDPLFRRLTFLLAGVASPAQLIKDNRRTPFNIGHSLSVTDFTTEEAKVLLAGLGLPVVAEHPALQRVLHWTSGHPYLTQRVFLKLAEDLEDEPQPSDQDWERLVDKAVGDTFLRPGARTREAHLEDIAKRRIGDLSKPGNPNFEPDLKRHMLALYRSAWQGHTVKDDPISKPCIELKLCGLLVTDREDPSRLVVRNRIYRTVFDADWIRGETPRNRWKRIAVTVAVMAVISISGLTFWERRARIADLVAQIERAETDVPTAAFNQLRSYPVQEERANELLAGYWARRARLASVERSRDEAAILWLKALSTHELPEARLQARRALSGNLPNVLATLRHTAIVNHAEFSSDGRRVVTASNDNTARVWDAETGQPIGSPLRHIDSVNHAAFSPRGRRVVTASKDNTARVWDAETGQSIGDPLKHDDSVNHAVLSADGLRVATASSDNSARIWDADTGQPIGSPLKHDNTVYLAEFSVDGRRVVTASNDRTARIWDAETGQPVCPPLKHADSVNHAAFSADGRRVVTASEDKTAQVWDAETGQPIGSPLKHQGPLWHAAFSADGRRVVTASHDHTAQIWDAETGQPIGPSLKHEDHVLHAAFNADGRRVITASEDHTAQVWDAETGQPLDSPLIHESVVIHAAFSANGRRVITASEDGTARVWSAETNDPLGNPLPLKHDASVRYAAFSTDGQRVATASDDNTAQIWDVETEKPVHELPKHKAPIRHMAFSVDGERFITASDDNTAQVWNVQTGLPASAPLKHEAQVRYAAFSVDRQRVVTAGNDSTARIWKTETGEPLGSPLRHENHVHSAEFSTDGRRIASGDNGGIARVWDAEMCRPIGGPLKHDGVVHQVAFSWDGQRVVTTSDDRTARIWDAMTGELLGSPLKHDNPVIHASFSKDGRRIVTATSERLTWYVEQSPNNWQPQATVWTNGIHWLSSPLLKDPNGETIRIADSWTGDVLLVRDFSLHKPEKDLPALEGTPEELLQSCLKQFALEFVDEKKSPTLRPVVPVSTRDNAARNQRDKLSANPP